MVSPLMSRYGEAYERLLERHRDIVFIEATRMPAEGELFSKDSPTFAIRLKYIDERVGGFLDQFRNSSLYAIGDPDTDADGELAALDDAITLYAMGGVDIRGVEACARAYVKACKRPEPVKVGNEEPPTYREQRRDTYHYSQYRPTEADRAARKQFAKRAEEQARLDRELWASSVQAHQERYPSCASRYCPYCRIDADDLQII